MNTLVNCEETERLCKLDLIAHTTVLIVTKPLLMRGFDYRAPKMGIELLIAKSFENQRAYEQGLGRVGRNRDPCKRFLLEKLDPVDKAIQNQLSNRLN